MADVNQQIEEAPNMIVKLTDQSGNLKKELKNSIHETVSSLRNLIFILKDNLNERICENSQLQIEVKELEAHTNPHTARQVAPSIDSTPGLTRGRNATSSPPSDGRKKLYAEALKGKNEMRYKLTVKSKDNQFADTVKKLLKSSIDPIDIKIGIRVFKGLKDGKVLIEADTKDDIEILNSQIRD
jgi:regulator of replication initiation timing